MRDPQRIRPFLEKLGEFWERYPDWRFGQLVVNLSRDSEGRVQDPWNFDVEEFSRQIDEFVDESELSDDELIRRIQAQSPVPIPEDLLREIVGSLREVMDSEE